MTMKQTAQAAGRGVLAIGIAATCGAKYGLSFASDLTKTFVGGAQNMANEMANGTDLGLGKFLYEKTEKTAKWGLDKMIALQKALKSKLR